MKTLSRTEDTVGLYLQEIGRYPLLKKHEEVELGKKVVLLTQIVEAREKLLEDVEATNAQIAAHLGISEAEVKRREYEGQRAKQQMIECNMRLVVSVAKKYQGRGVDFLDLIQEGSLGLAKGVDKFDPTKGYKFSTYAYWWIWQNITRSIVEKGRTIRLPIHINEKLNKIKKAYRELAVELNRDPKIFEVAERLDSTPDDVRWLLSLKAPARSLNSFVGKEEDTELLEIFADHSESTFERVAGRTLTEDIKMALETYLNPQERRVIELRFGLKSGGMRPTLEEVGIEIGVCKERVRQIQTSAIRKLRSGRAVKSLQSWMEEVA